MFIKKNKARYYQSDVVQEISPLLTLSSPLLSSPLLPSPPLSSPRPVARNFS